MAGAPQATPALNTFGHAQGWPEGLLEVGIWLGGSWPHMCPSCLELGLTAGRDGLGVAGDCCGAEEPLQVGAEPQHEPCRDGCTEHGCTEHSLLCLSRGDTEPTPCPGAQSRLTSTGLWGSPTPCQDHGLALQGCTDALWREKHQEQLWPGGARVPSPAHSSVPKPAWGTQGSSQAPILGWNTAGLKPAAWKNAHSGRVPSNKFIVFYYIFPFLHLIPIPHIQTLLSERK